jgi:hypothetical protein
MVAIVPCTILVLHVQASSLSGRVQVIHGISSIALSIAVLVLKVSTSWLCYVATSKTCTHRVRHSFYARQRAYLPTLIASHQIDDFLTLPIHNGLAIVLCRSGPWLCTILSPCLRGLKGLGLLLAGHRATRLLGFDFSLQRIWLATRPTCSAWFLRPQPIFLQHHDTFLLFLGYVQSQSRT